MRPHRNAYCQLAYMCMSFQIDWKLAVSVSFPGHTPLPMQFAERRSPILVNQERLRLGAMGQNDTNPFPCRCAPFSQNTRER